MRKLVRRAGCLFVVFLEKVDTATLLLVLFARAFLAEAEEEE